MANFSIFSEKLGKNDMLIGCFCANFTNFVDCSYGKTMMHIAVCNKVDLSELPAILGQLPEWRRQRALRFRYEIDQFLCAKSYLLLCDLLKTPCGIAEQPEFAFGKNGKPFLPKFPEIHFNLSHCKRAIVCVIASEPVGCDVEEIGETPSEALLNRCCNAAEKALILQSEAPEIAFAELWTQKEAFLKLTGEGLTNDLPKIFERKPDTINLKSEIYNEKRFVLSIAISQKTLPTF